MANTPETKKKFKQTYQYEGDKDTTRPIQIGTIKTNANGELELSHNTALIDCLFAFLTTINTTYTALIPNDNDKDITNNVYQILSSLEHLKINPTYTFIEYTIEYNSVLSNLEALLTSTSTSTSTDSKILDVIAKYNRVKVGLQEISLAFIKQEIKYYSIITVPQTGGALQNTKPNNTRWQNITNNKKTQYTFGIENNSLPNRRLTTKKTDIQQYFDNCEDHQQKYIDLHNNVLALFNFILLIIKNIIEIIDIIRVLSSFLPVSSLVKTGIVDVKIPDNIITETISNIVNNADTIKTALTKASSELDNTKFQNILKQTYTQGGGANPMPKIKFILEKLTDTTEKNKSNLVLKGSKDELDKLNNKILYIDLNKSDKSSNNKIILTPISDNSTSNKSNVYENTNTKDNNNTTSSYYAKYNTDRNTGVDTIISTFNALSSFEDQLASIDIFDIGLKSDFHASTIKNIEASVNIIKPFIEPLSNLQNYNDIESLKNQTPETIAIDAAHKDRIELILLRCYDLQILYLYKHLEFKTLQSYVLYYLYILYDYIYAAIVIIYLYDVINVDSESIPEEVNITNIIDKVNTMIKDTNTITNTLYNKDVVQVGGSLVVSDNTQNPYITEEVHKTYKLFDSTLEDYSTINKYHITKQIHIYSKLFNKYIAPYITSNFNNHNITMITNSTTLILYIQLKAILLYFATYDCRNQTVKCAAKTDFNATTALKLFEDTNRTDTITISAFLSSEPFNFKLIDENEIGGIRDSTNSKTYMFYICKLLCYIALDILRNYDSDTDSFTIKKFSDYENDDILKQRFITLKNKQIVGKNTDILYNYVKTILDDAITTQKAAEDAAAQKAAEEAIVAQKVAEEAIAAQKAAEETAAAQKAAEEAIAAQKAAEDAAAQKAAEETAAAQKAATKPDDLMKQFLNSVKYQNNINLINILKNFYEKYFNTISTANIIATTNTTATNTTATNTPVLDIIKQIEDEYNLNNERKTDTTLAEWELITGLCNTFLTTQQSINTNLNTLTTDEFTTQLHALQTQLDNILKEDKVFTTYKEHSYIIAEIVNGAVRVIIKDQNNDSKDTPLVAYDPKEKTITFSNATCKSTYEHSYGPYSDFYDKNTHLDEIYTHLFKPNADTKEPPTQTPTHNSSRIFHNFNAKINAGGTVVLFGYGQSGAGKSFTLIEGAENNKAPNYSNNQSILNQFIKEHAASISKIEFSEIYPYNAYNAYKNMEDKVVINHEKNIYEKTEGDTSVTIIAKVSNIIKLINAERIKNLRILQTPNNKESSRSFLKISIYIKIGTIEGILVIFDMPGSESTVHIKKAMYGYEIFSKIKNVQDTLQNSTSCSFTSTSTNTHIKLINKNFTFYFKNTDCTNANNKSLVTFKYKNTEYKSIEDSSIEDALITLLFKERLITMISLRQFICTNSAGIKIENTEITELFIGKCLLEITLFFNCRNSLFENNNNIVMLTDDNIKYINANFLTTVIFEKEEKDTKTKDALPEHAVPAQAAPPIEEIKYDEILSNTSLSSNYDTKNIKNIYGITTNINVDKQSQYVMCVLNQEQFNVLTVWLSITGSPLYKFIFIKRKNTDTETTEEVCFKYFKIVKETHTTPTTTTTKQKKHVQTTKEDTISYQFHLRTNSTGECISPMIKYFLIFMILILIDTNQAYSKYKPGALLIFIYKYVNFIVEQGKSIVTSLEHLKYFFLANTNQISAYNKMDDDKAMTYKPTDKQKKDITNKVSENILDHQRTYKISTDIGNKTMIDEIVNCGEMTNYKLLEQLQQLAHRPIEFNNCLAGNPQELDILKCNTTEQKVRTQPVLGTSTITEPEVSKKQTLFIMIAHIKEFFNRNRTYNTDQEQSQICDATHSTLEFAQSVSSSRKPNQPKVQALTTQSPIETVPEQLSSITAQTQNKPTLRDFRGSITGAPFTRGGYRDNTTKQKTPSQNTKKHNTNNTHNDNLYTKYNKPYKHKTVKKSLNKDKSLFRFNTKLNKIKYTQ